MAIGADIAPADPAVVRTRGMRSEVTGGLDVAATASGERHAGWWRARQPGMRVHAWFTDLALWLARAPCKRLRFTLAPRRLRRRWRRRAATPTPMGQENQEDEEYTGDEIESQVGPTISPFD
jgi:hypothetical protein